MPYQGLIKDVRIYDCAMSAAEVQAIDAEQNVNKGAPVQVVPKPAPPVPVGPELKE